MPKIDPDATPGMKLLGLYWLFLFTGRKYFLSELAAHLKCSKQTVLRLMTQLEVSEGVYIESGLEDRRRWFRLEQPKERPRVSLSASDIRNLLLCRDMVWHLLPEQLRQEVEKTIGHASALIPEQSQRAEAWTPQAVGRSKGRIDYSGREEVLDKIRRAMTDKKVCRVIYCSAAHPEGRCFHIAPLLLLAYREVLSVWCWQVPEEGEARQVYDTNLHIHRIKEVEITERRFEADEADLPQPKKTFGYMEGKPFQVKVVFSSDAAPYVRERVWSEDQVIEEAEDGTLTLTMTATSVPEVISWVLSFRDEAELLEPPELRTDLAEIVSRLGVVYG